MTPDRKHRTRILLGNDTIQKLEQKTIMVIGCGAVGSFAIEALARVGIGTIIIMDHDTVAETNINRQLFALDSTIGKKKVAVAAKRIHDINPDIKVIAYDEFFDDTTIISETPDFVIDAIDTVNSKIAIYKWCQADKIPFISSMGAARKTDPSKIKVSKLSKTIECPMAARIRKLVRDAHLHDFPVVFSTETAAPHHTTDKEFGSIITVTGTFGLLLANYAIKHTI